MNECTTNHAISDDFTYVMDLTRPEGTPIASFPIEPDFGPALESARFAVVRDELGDADTNGSEAVIRPLWDQNKGAPLIEAVEVHGGAEQSTVRVAAALFDAIARKRAAGLVAKGRLVAGEEYVYAVAAYAKPRAERPGKGVPFVAVEVPQPLSIKERGLAEVVTAAAAVSYGDGAEDIAVVLAPGVVQEAAARCLEAGALETGGILVGELCRDPDTRRLFLDVRAQIEAPHTEAREASLTFTHETWAAVRGAIALRGGSELMVGWWHYHPFGVFCRNCPAASRPGCVYGTKSLFSEDDVVVHRTCFERAYHAALLLSDLGDGLSASLYGWRRGVVCERELTLTPPVSAQLHTTRIHNNGGSDA